VKIEHAAYQVEDPAAVARWYVEHLGMTLKRSQAERPWGQFLADSADAVMLEFYNHPKATVPAYRDIDPLVLHVAFAADDLAAVRARLLQAGATAVGDINTNPLGDQLAMLRDPWGFAIQLVHRSEPMI
jgi:catechol 2,3-dioxygenase-like lactoylglutathione lyase family enzyme